MFKNAGANAGSSRANPADEGNKPPDSDRSSMCYYGSWLTRHSWFPKIGKDGVVYTTSGVGRVAANNKRIYDTQQKLSSHLKKHLIGGCRVVAGPPSDRAIEYVSSGQQQTLFGGGAVVQKWTKEKALLAAREFEVPQGTQFVLIMPDIFERDILAKHKPFKLVTEEKEGTKTKKRTHGILTPCPDCGSNKHITPAGYNCHRSKATGIKDTDGDTIFLISSTYKCTNPNCGDGKQSRQFSLHAQST